MKLRGGWLWTAVAALGALGYATGVEPYAIEVTRRDLWSPRLPRAFDGFTVCQISDLHMTQMGRRERAVKRLMESLPTPDLVAVTGDMVHTSQGIEPFRELARSFVSRHGTYAVFGNSEHKNGIRPHAFARTLAEGGIVPILNRHITLQRGEDSILVAGVDDPVNDRDRLADALRDAPNDLFTLLLMHSPDSIADAVVHGVDVVLSGHTHGGQVCLPGFGPLHTHSLFGLRMSAGLYAGSRLRHLVGIRPGRTQLYVTRGLGVSGLALRFFAPPELTLLTLRRGAVPKNL
jgi:predicted MPP superfamily phosphohydrolase